MKYQSTIKKNEIFPFARIWTDQHIILSRVSQIENDKYCTLSLTCGIKKNKTMNDAKNKNRLANIESNLMVPTMDGEEGKSQTEVWY